MRLRRSLSFTASAALVGASLLAVACSDDGGSTTPDDTTGSSDTVGGDASTPGAMTCVGCHTSEDMLKEAVASLNLPPPEVHGTGDG